MVLALPYFKGGFLTNTEMNEITPWLWFWHKTPGSFFWVNILFSYKWGIVHFSQCAKKSCRLAENYGVFEFFILVNFGIQPCMPPPPPAFEQHPAERASPPGSVGAWAQPTPPSTSMGRGLRQTSARGCTAT